MNLAAAALSTVLFLSAGVSAALILSKYCFTRVSSIKTGCSRALTPLSRRYARERVKVDLAFEEDYSQNNIDSIA
jgi:hypothetical protein